MTERTFKKLPQILQTNTLDKFFQSTIDQWFSDDNTSKVTGYIGRKDPKSFKPDQDFFLPEIDYTRQNYQLEPVLTTKDIDTAEITNALFYDDTIKTLAVEGSNVDNHNRLFKSKAYSWAPPIDIDKFINYENYYWYEPAELIRFDIIQGSTNLNIVSDIIGKTSFTSYNEVKFTNGLKVRFTGSNISPQGYLNKDYIVTGVGTSIDLLDITSPVLNDTRAYTPTLITDKIDYITIERGAVDTNPWSRTNGWYHKDVLLRGTGISTGVTYNDIVDNPWDKTGDVWDEVSWDSTVTQKATEFALDSARKAVRPIIEFDNDLELYNYGIESAGIVNFAADQTYDIVHNASNVTIDGITIATDDTIIFLNSTNLLTFIKWDGEKIVNATSGATEGQWDSKPWDIDSGSGADQLGKIYRATVTSGVCTLVEIKSILTKQKILVTEGDERKGLEYHWTGSDWILSQSKTAQNDEPLFQLYDLNTIKLDDIGIYPSSDFTGNPIFSYKMSTGTADVVIGKALEYKEFGQVADIVFQNNLEDTTTWGTSSKYDIFGYKYYNQYNLNRDIGDVTFIENVDLVEDTLSYNNIHGNLSSQIAEFDDIASYDGKKIILINNAENYTSARWDIDEWDDDTPAEIAWAEQVDLALLEGQTGIYTINIDTSNGISRVLLNLTTTINHGDYVTISDGILYSGKDMTWQTDGWTEVKFKIPPETRKIDNFNNSWNPTNVFNKQRVIEKYKSDVDGTQEYILQTTPVTNSPADVIVTVDGDLAKQSTTSTAYDYNISDNTLTFTTNKILSKDQLIEVKSFTKDAVNLNDVHYFEIPDSLEANPDNNDITSASSSELQEHFTSIIQNQSDFSGIAYGNNNYRDSKKDLSLGLKILQHESSMLPLMGLLANHESFHILDSIRFNQRQYVNFKNKFLQRAEFLVTKHLTTPIDVFVDTILLDMYSTRSNLKVFQETKAFAFGDNFIKTDVTVPFNADHIDLSSLLSITGVNDRTKIIYIYKKNNIETNYSLLNQVSDYKFATTITSSGTTVTRIIFTDGVQKDDKIQIREFENIQNSFVPSTPSMLGMYQVYRPKAEGDNTYFNGTKNFIVGHDGSRTLMYGDYKDDCLLELEKRIYNAIPDKFISEDYMPELNQYEYVPGKFRDNDYSLFEYNRIMEPIYQRWSVENKVDTFTHRDYDGSSPFTWNYATEADRDGKEVPGAWRGIYLYYYDTHRPHTHPWEMLGFASKPSWWDAQYGTTLETNTALWSDLENGIIRAGARENFTDSSYLTNNPFKRTGLSNYIPVDGYGTLKDPVQSGIFGDPAVQITASGYTVPYGPHRDDPWRNGDYGPAEFSIRLNPVWPFIINKLAFLTRPAEWATKNWDTLNLKRAKAQKAQILFEDTSKRKKISELRFHQLGLTDTSTTKEYVFGYQQWIYNLLLDQGISYDVGFANDIKTAGVNLGYKTGGFISNNNITIQADSYSTTRDSDSIFIPIEDKSVAIYNSASEGVRSYSGVIIEVTSTGYKVFGYDPFNPVFRIIPSVTTGPSNSVDTEEVRVEEYTTHYDVVAEVEYGFEFSNVQEVFDFLISYQRYLTAVGFIFDEWDIDAETILDWKHAGKEFIFWAQLTTWDDGAFIALSPSAHKIKLDSTSLGRISSINEIINGTYSILDKNGGYIPASNLNIKREADTFSVSTVSGIGIYGLKVNTFKSEHVMFFENKTGFNDLIYDPVFRLRQEKLKLSAVKTNDWTGKVESGGYIIQNDTILPNFNTVANDYRKFHNTTDAVVSKAQRDSARHLTGYQPRDYLTNITGNDDISYEFYKGFIRQKGSNQSIKSLLRNTNITNEDALTLYEEFALKLSDFGATRITTDNEILIKATDVKVQNPLIEFTYESTSVDSLNDDVIQLNHTNDTRWLRKPKTPVMEVWPKNTIGTTEITALPTAGYVHKDDITYRAYDNTTLAGLNTNVNATTEPTVGSTAHIARGPNNEFSVHKLVDSGLKPEIIERIDGSITTAIVNITGQAVPTIVGTLITPTTKIGDTFEVTFDNDAGTKTTVALSTAEAASVDDPDAIPELTLELKTDVTSIAVNDSIYVNTTTSGAGTEVIFNSTPTDRPVVVIGTTVNPAISATATLLQINVDGTPITLAQSDDLAAIVSTITSGVANVTASAHNNILRIQKDTGGILTLYDPPLHEGTLRSLGIEEGTYYNDITITEILAAIIAADVPNLTITKISDTRLKLKSTTNRLEVKEGVGQALDRLLFTDKNGFEKQTVDTSQITIDTIVIDLNGGITQEDFLASKTAGGLLKLEYNGTALTIGGTGLAGVGMSSQTISITSSAISQHNFNNGDVIILKDVKKLDGSNAEIDGGYVVSLISETHIYNVKIVNGDAIITNKITNAVTTKSNVSSLSFYDIVSADRDYIKEITLDITSAMAPIQIKLGDTVDDGSILTSMVGYVDKYYGTEKLFSVPAGNITLKSVSGNPFTSGEFNISFTIEKKGKFTIPAIIEDTSQSASNILWWHKRNFRTKENAFANVQTNKSFYNLNDFVYIDNKPNGWVTSQHLDTLTHFGINALTVSSGGTNYVAADIGIPLSYATDVGNTVTSPSFSISAIDYKIKSIAITNKGQGYSSPPAVIFTGGGFDTEAVGQAVLSSAITDITVTNKGLGYQQVPTVEVSSSPSYSGKLWEIKHGLGQKLLNLELSVDSLTSKLAGTIYNAPIITFVDANNLTVDWGSTVTIGSIDIIKSEFVSSLQNSANIWNVTHNLGTQFCTIDIIYDDDTSAIGRLDHPIIEHTDANNVKVIFPTGVQKSGYVVCDKGTNNGTHIHTNTAATVWTVNHNLGKKLSNVDVTTLGSNIVSTDYTASIDATKYYNIKGNYDYPIINFVNENQLTVTFAQATAGKITVTRGPGTFDIVAVTTPHMELSHAGAGLVCSGIYLKNGGTGYTGGGFLGGGDLLTINNIGATFSEAAQFHVETVDGSGTITAISEVMDFYTYHGDYTVLPTTLINNQPTGGTGSGCQVDLNWSVKSLDVTDPGSFQVTPEIKISAPINGSGCTSLVTATATATLSGIVNSVTIIDGGTGYDTAPTISFSGGGGSLAAATATLAGSISAITISNIGDVKYQPSSASVAVIGTTAGSGLTVSATYKDITSFDTWFNTYRQEEKPINSKLFNVAKLYDKTEHTVDATLQIIDPPKGIISGLADTEIQYKLERDPARYNFTESTATEFAYDTDDLWGEKQVGLIWWDLSTVRFINAELGENRYRREQWGQLFPGSSIDIYEWVSSSITPALYTGTGTVMNEERYCELEVWNDSINMFITTYFFWVKDKTDIPGVDFRSRSAIDVRNYITNPTKQGLSWYAPISHNYEWTEEIAITNTNTTQTIGLTVLATEIASVTINGVKVNWAMGMANTDGKINTIILMSAPTINDSLRIGYKRSGGAMIVNNIDHLLTIEDSVLQLRYNTKPTEGNVHKQWTLIRPGDPRSSVPPQFINKFIDSITGYDITGLVIPDSTILNDIEKYGTLTRPRQTWFKDVKKARKELVTFLNIKLAPLALDDERIAWDASISSSLITTEDWYGVKESVTSDEGITTNTHWNTDTAVVKYTVNTVTERNALTNMVMGDIVKVINAGSNRWKLYQFAGWGILTSWIAIASEKATRQFATTIYTDDLTITQSTELRTIINALFNNVFIADWYVYKNETIFNMINYVLSEQSEIDWIFKSTYATTTVTENDIAQKDKWKVDLLPNTQEYINEVKPYSSKIRSLTGVKSIKLDPAKTHSTDFDNPPYKDILGIFGTANTVIPLQTSIIDHLPTLQSGIYSDYFANKNNTNKIRATTIKMHFDRIHPTMEEPKTYTSGVGTIAGVDSRPVRRTFIKTEREREVDLLQSIVSASGVGVSSATQIGGALHRILKYSLNRGDGAGGISGIIKTLVNFKLTVDTDIANHYIIVSNGLNSLASLTYEHLTSKIEQTDTYYTGMNLTISEAVARYDYDQNSVLRAGPDDIAPFGTEPAPGKASEAQNKINIFINRYENGLTAIREKLYDVNGSLNSDLKLQIEDSSRFTTAIVGPEADTWGWDSDVWDHHEHDAKTGQDVPVRSWDEGGNLDINYSEFNNYSSEKLISGDKVGWHIFDLATRAGIETVKYSTKYIYVQASGLPDHKYGPFPNANNPNTVKNQNALWKIPLEVVVPITADKEVVPMGAIAIARNGVVFFNPKSTSTYLNEDIWHENAVTTETGIDDEYGHADETNRYHYHQNPKAMYDDSSYAHSPLLGYAFDGVPIYGPRSFTNTNGTGEIQRMRSSYRLKSGTRTAIGSESVPSGNYDGKYIEDYEYVNGLGNLDQYNGRSAITPEYPSGVYAYYITVDDLGASAYPYIIGTKYYGRPLIENYLTEAPPTITEDIPVQDRYLSNVSTDRNDRDSKGFQRPQYEQHPEEFIPIAPKEGLQITTQTHAVSVKFAGTFTRSASGYATVSGGGVTGITITDPGAGYTSVNVVISGSYATSVSPLPSGCTATATIGTGADAGKITSATVTAPGTNYFDLALSWRQYYDANAEKRIYALGDETSTTLTSNLTKGGTEIQVTDVTKLPMPVADSYNKGFATPGVVFIGTERIEYFDVDVANNKLLDCRRGTVTTSDESHTTGTNIYGITSINTMTGNYETMWAPHNTYGLTNSGSSEARFLRDNKGTALT